MRPQIQILLWLYIFHCRKSNNYACSVGNKKPANTAVKYKLCCFLKPRHSVTKKAQALYRLRFSGFTFFRTVKWWTSAELNRGLTAVRKAFYTFSLRLISGKRFRKRTLLSHAFKVPRRTKEGYSVRAIPHLKWRFFLRRGQRKEKRCLKLN